MGDKTDWSVSILKYMYGISSFRFFRFSMSLHEPSGFCLINIAEICSPVLCSHFVITPFAKRISKLWQTRLLKLEECRSYVFLLGQPKFPVPNPTLFVVSLYHWSTLSTNENSVLICQL